MEGEGKGIGASDTGFAILPSVPAEEIVKIRLTQEDSPPPDLASGTAPPSTQSSRVASPTGSVQSRPTPQTLQVPTPPVPTPGRSEDPSPATPPETRWAEGPSPDSLLNFLLVTGFLGGLLIASVSLWNAGSYLNAYLSKLYAQDVDITILKANPAAISGAQLYFATHFTSVKAKFALISCGMFTSLAFGSLGFSLLIANIRATMDADVEHLDSSLSVKGIYQGVVIMVLSMILAGFCVGQRLDFQYTGPMGRLTVQDTGGGSSLSNPWDPAPSASPSGSQSPETGTSPTPDPSPSTNNHP